MPKVMVYGVDMFLISVSRSSIFLVFQDYFLLKNSSLAFNNYFLEFYNSRNSSKCLMFLAMNILLSI